MDNIVLKGSKHGIKIIISPDAQISDIEKEILEKISLQASFFKNAVVALEFEGKRLTGEEEANIVRLINESGVLKVAGIIDESAETENRYINYLKRSDIELFNNTVNNNALENKVFDIHNAYIYHGVLRSGQDIERDESVVIIGDVNPGAKISSGGSIVVFGSLKGIAWAGLSGDTSAFVMAQNMQPLQIRVGNTIARGADDAALAKAENKTKIAFAMDGNIYIEDFADETLNEIKF